MKKKTNEEFVQDAIKVHGDKYDYSKVKYINSSTKVIIICKEHGEFEQCPDKHINRKSQCIKCVGKYQYTSQEFVKNAQTIHDDKYDYSKVKYINSSTKLIIICKEHGEFEQLPSSHLAGRGCSKCKYVKHGELSRYNSQQFIKKAQTIHGDKYDYSKVDYTVSKNKVIIICKEHGEFTQLPSGHLDGKGCGKCGRLICGEKLTMCCKLFISKAIEVHGDKYDYSKVSYVNSSTKVMIICKEHGEFEQNPGGHLQGNGCSKCSGHYSYTTEEWIEKATEVHGDKYNYSKVNYYGNKNKIMIICKYHGIFQQQPIYHLSGNQGCSKCNLCASCQLWRTWGKLCEYCQPKNKKKIYEKTKEYAVVKYLREKLPDYDFIHNKSVGAECTKDEKENSNGHLFPDIRFDCYFYHLIVEVDENKHRGVDYKCDVQRMYNIIAKLGLPCIFIRYNPDSQSSNKYLLLKKIEEYLELDIEEDDIWDDYGFKVEYLFY